MPRWTQEDLDAYEARRLSHRAQPQPVVCHESLGQTQGKEEDTKKVLLRITSFRVRLLDPDNLTGGCKYLIDCCRRAGLIPDDDPASITLVVSQVKVTTHQQEMTEIEII